MTDEKKVTPLFDALAMDVNPVMGVKAKMAKRLMADIVADPGEAQQFHLWRGIYAQTHGKVPDVADAFIAATARERMGALIRGTDYAASPVGVLALETAAQCEGYAAKKGTNPAVDGALLLRAADTIRSLIEYIKTAGDV